jgi:hypothetical protein
MNFRETDFEEVNWNDAVHNEVHCVSPVVMGITCWLRKQQDI